MLEEVKQTQTDKMVRELKTIIGLRTTLDKILFSVCILLTVILFAILYILWRRRRAVRIRPFINEEGVKSTTAAKNEKAQSENETTEEEESEVDSRYPIITILQRSRSSPDEQSFSSDVSSLWDSTSQVHDRSYFNASSFSHNHNDDANQDADIETGGLSTTLTPPQELSNKISTSSEVPSQDETHNETLPSVQLKVHDRPGNFESQSDNIVLEQRDIRDERSVGARERCFSI